MFVETIRNALNLSVSDDKLDLVIRELPQHFDYQERHISNITQDVLGKIRGTGVGLYTFRFNELFGHADEVNFCRVESLRTDLMAFFERVGVANDELRDYVLGQDKMNSSEHVDCTTYYTKDLAELVAIRDRPLIERFGFTFNTGATK